MKLDPEDLKQLAEDLDNLKADYIDIMTAEPLIRKPIEDAAKYAKKKYEDVRS